MTATAETSSSSVEQQVVIVPLTPGGLVRHQGTNVMWQMSCCKPESLAEEDGSLLSLCVHHSALPHRLGSRCCRAAVRAFYLEEVPVDGWELLRLTQKTLSSLAGCSTAAGLCLAAVGKSICLLCSGQQPVLPGSHRLLLWWP